MAQVTTILFVKVEEKETFNEKTDARSCSKQLAKPERDCRQSYPQSYSLNCYDITVSFRNLHKGAV